MYTFTHTHQSHTVSHTQTTDPNTNKSINSHKKKVVSASNPKKRFFFEKIWNKEREKREERMPFVIPYYKKPAKLRERYKTVESNQAFDLQVLKRGKPSISRPLCRILVRAFDRCFVIALVRSLLHLKEKLFHLKIKSSHNHSYRVHRRSI